MPEKNLEKENSELKREVESLKKRLKELEDSAPSKNEPFAGNQFKKVILTEKRYKTVFENSGTAVVIFKDDDIITLCNSNFEKLSGYKKAEIEGKMKWYQFVSLEDLELMKEYHEKRKRGEHAPAEYRFRFIDREQNVKQLYLQVGLMRETRERIVSLIDITEKHELRKNLLK